jgi:hypothetical protein
MTAINAQAGPQRSIRVSIIFQFYTAGMDGHISRRMTVMKEKEFE